MSQGQGAQLGRTHRVTVYGSARPSRLHRGRYNLPSVISRSHSIHAWRSHAVRINVSTGDFPPAPAVELTSALVLLSRLDAFNRRHPWSHNDHSGSWVIRKVVDAGARHVLDVGCGTGNLIACLHRNATTVTGLEPDPATARLAAEFFAGDPDVTIVVADFAGREPKRRWDAITLVAVLHHFPLVSTLRECLTPGGRLVIVGCHREESPQLCSGPCLPSS